ncbi:MAG: hypothetical protein IK144_00450 [Bacteroidaceae bacterium]|nr:hypothetical protein [Bacteroidaceae bacterium]
MRERARDKGRLEDIRLFHPVDNYLAYCEDEGIVSQFTSGSPMGKETQLSHISGKVTHQ